MLENRLYSIKDYLKITLESNMACIVHIHLELIIPIYSVPSMCLCIASQPWSYIVPFMLLAAYPLVKALFANPLVQQTRRQAMPQVLSVNVVLGAFYAASILACTTVTLIL